MEPILAVLLGILQGLTEWLPISSSGHLVLTQHLLGIDVPVAFDVALHLGTLIAVSVYLRRDIFNIIKSALRPSLKNTDFRMAALVISGTIPTALIGILFLGFFESLFQSPQSACAGLFITGFLLVLSKFLRVKGKDCLLDFKRSGIIGIFQGIAIAPGISRSGSTISSALIMGVDKGTAFRYSFLLSIPAILGASVVEMLGRPSGTLGMETIAGVIAAAFSGYLALALVRKVLAADRFHYFSIYCFALGTAVFLLL